MNVRKMGLSLNLLGALSVASAAQGLAPPAAETLWPHWQARITLVTANSNPLALAPLSSSGQAPRGLRGAALLGDYIFATPAYGQFRASGGVVSGPLVGLPLATATAGARLGVSVLGSAGTAWAPGADTPTTLPYLGLGFSGATGLGGLALTADLGVVAERPEAAAGVGRALFGNQGVERALREMRLSPVLQLGMRYTF